MLVTMLQSTLLAAVATLGQEPQPPKDQGLTGPLTEAEFKALHEKAAEESVVFAGTGVTLESGARAYLALPQASGSAKSGPHPAVVVIHEWWGLNTHIRLFADRLARQGYAALAVDLYEGEEADTSERAMELMRGVDEARALAHLKSAVAFLREDGRVAAPKVGTLGFCFGGAWSLRAALEIEGLDACVIYYGRLVTDPERLKAIEAPVLGIFGTQDKSIPPETVKEFEDALETAGVRHEIASFDANHAFANPSSARYEKAAAKQAWERTRAFLQEHLAPEDE